MLVVAPKTHSASPHEQNIAQDQSSASTQGSNATPPHAVQITLGSEERVLFGELLRLLGELSQHLGKSNSQEFGLDPSPSSQLVSNEEIPDVQKQKAGKLQATSCSSSRKGSVPIYRSRARKPPVASGPIVNNGIYRISNVSRRDDTTGFLEMQDNNSVAVVALDEASEGQKVSSPLPRSRFLLIYSSRVVEDYTSGKSQVLHQVLT